MIEIKRPYERMHIIGPHSRVTVSITGFVREPMTAKIQRHQSMIGRQSGAHLPAPDTPALRESVDEYDRPPARIARLHRVELRSPSAGDRVSLHGSPLLRCAL